MAWNKVKKQLESFISPSVAGQVEYSSTGYRYVPQKSSQCYILVQSEEVFNMVNTKTGISWYQTEQDIKNDENFRVRVTEEDIESVRKQSNNNIPEDRLKVIAEGHKKSRYAKEILNAQQHLLKSDFQKTVTVFMSESIEKSLESDDILLNVLAIIDRRVGKKRLQNMREVMYGKHPVVQYFYRLRV